MAQQPEGESQGQSFKGQLALGVYEAAGSLLSMADRCGHRLSKREFNQAKNLPVGAVFKKPLDMRKSGFGTGGLLS